MHKRFDIRQGDCREVMSEMAENSVDAIVTDPPYGLSFRGKEWDHGVPGVEFWAEALRVAKPGAHLLAFGGTRTFHRLACAIEDAGWEIRDTVGWIYGLGFPKSLDVSKAIDKMDAAQEQEARRYRFTAWVRSTGVTAQQIDEATGTNMGGHYTTAASQPAIMTREHLEACRHLLSDVPEWVERETDIRSVKSKTFAQREVVGTKVAGIATPGDVGRHTIGGSRSVEVNITAPATDAARKWAGWGTALKPAWEPVIVARKPLDGTVAHNVLTHGTGAINVDGCRVGTHGGGTNCNNRDDSGECKGHPMANGSLGDGIMRHGVNKQTARWPANLIHDGSDEVMGLFPVTKSGNGNKRPRKPSTFNASPKNGRFEGGLSIGGDSGSAARFFYCAKASKADRDAGCERNIHPTVKPTNLMRYLCRLVTPPGGVVLDPFMGSGSTGKAAMMEGFRFVGIELNPEYIEIARARIEHALNDKKGSSDEQEKLF